MMLRVYCSRHSKDQDMYLQQAVGAYSNTKRSSTGFTSHMMLTGYKRSTPFIFFYKEYQFGKESHSKKRVQKKLERLQEIKKMVRANLKAAQIRQKETTLLIYVT